MDGEADVTTRWEQDLRQMQRDLYDVEEGLIPRVRHIERRVDQILVTAYGVVVALVIGFGSVVITLLASRP